ncbi:Uncharacterized conserved protein, DUF427 family [Devosia lucknowensis]|uniref:Uncharacterized conserved protein, DUF427 family n=1 Tax=Devosia lucknowensis TaxID=1096929 RepID=A0A1Y6E977_9HYPH|nr:DUF427 domain-containing protein [Devosia lucknowensis]SMQ59164.1 Uncharacterized conserved protein, DUF427 family [Devosia lucknowensis]
MVQPTSSLATVTPVAGRVHFSFDDAEIASSTKAFRLDHDGREPIYFVPLEDVHPGILEASDTVREEAGPGEAHFYTIKTLTADGVDQAWYFPYADGDYGLIRDMLTFGGEKVAVRVSDV